MEELIGRETEIELLKEALESSDAELIAIYGRRRVGKTYLIRKVYEKNMAFELTGLNGATLSQQLENFSDTLSAAFALPTELPVPANWLKGFRMLIQLLEPKLAEQRQVVFLDEFPWLDSQKSGFLAAFDHFWNNWASKQRNLVVVLCGSAASWMIQNILQNTGGLHNRITRRIRLLPFTLLESERFLKSRGIELTRYQLLEMFMAMGGIPHYLKEIRRGESIVQAIDRICFSNDGLLRDEFKFLYAALFYNGERHVSVVRALANKPSGMTRNEITTACGMVSGGNVTKLLDELLESGFIAAHLPFQKTSKDAIFKLSDEYTLFYLKFIENSKAVGEGTWMKKSTSASWKSWSGLAFENICLKHVLQIKRALGIAGVYTEQSAWRFTAKSSDEESAQIDLVLDRQDQSINLLEIKFSLAELEIDKKTAESLDRKRRVFLQQTGTRKAIFTSLLTTFGAKKNAHFLATVHNQLTMNDLFS